MTVGTRMWLMGVNHVEGLCSECWLPGLYKMTFTFDTAGRVTVVERVSCFDCGNPQD